jgi:hypothetical protein
VCSALNNDREFCARVQAQHETASHGYSCTTYKAQHERASRHMDTVALRTSRARQLRRGVRSLRPFLRRQPAVCKVA